MRRWKRGQEAEFAPSSQEKGRQELRMQNFTKRIEGEPLEWEENQKNNTFQLDQEYYDKLCRLKLLKESKYPFLHVRKIYFREDGTIHSVYEDHANATWHSLRHFLENHQETTEEP